MGDQNENQRNDKPAGGEETSRSSNRHGEILKYSRNGRTISGKLHDEMVMMDIKLGKYFSLNPVATRVWELLEQPLSMDELCQKLVDEYDVEPGRCAAEIREHLAEMARLGLILVSTETAEST